MLFSEVYSIYYQVVSRLIVSAIDGELDYKKAIETINKQAFSESYIYTRQYSI